MIDWRRRFPRPDPDAVWCDECLRWETGPGRFPRVRVPVATRVLEVVADAVRWPGNRLAGWLTDRAQEAQVRENIKSGVFHARLP